MGYEDWSKCEQNLIVADRNVVFFAWKDHGGHVGAAGKCNNTNHAFNISN